MTDIKMSHNYHIGLDNIASTCTILNLDKTFAWFYWIFPEVCFKCKLTKTCSQNRLMWWIDAITSLPWRHNECDGVSNHQPHDCLLNRLFRCRWKKTSKLRVIGLCAGNSPMTGEFPEQRASNAENVSIWWRHHANQCWPSSMAPHCIPSLKTFICNPS